MATEIERKFLVRGTEWRQGAGETFRQGYLNRDMARTVRIRVAGDRAFLTVKGASKGASRPEFEYEIPASDAEHILKLCDGPLVEKFRRRIPYRGFVWEVDEFAGENTGLVIAEVELDSEDQAFERPPWVDREVTGDPRYYSSNLAANPYSLWRDR